MYLNSKLVYDSGDTYHLRSYLETELNYGVDAKSSHLSACLYNKEAGDNVDTNTNEGFVARQPLFANSSWVELMSPLHADLLMQDR